MPTVMPPTPKPSSSAAADPANDPPLLFFPTPAHFRAWLAEHHDQRDELWVGYYKKATGLPSITWPESVDEALCFGWIDGIRKSLDDKSYKIRFTPRRPGSHWSARNLGRMKHLIAEGLVTEPGMAAYRKRNPARAEAGGPRTEKHRPPARVRTAATGRRRRLGLLPARPPVVPQAGDLVGGQRQARGDPAPAPPHPDRIVGEGRGHPADAVGGEEEVTIPVAGTPY